VGWKTLLNRSGRAFRALPETNREGLTAKEGDRADDHNWPSTIKRSVLDVDGRLLVGLKPEEYEKALEARR